MKIRNAIGLAAGLVVGAMALAGPASAGWYENGGYQPLLRLSLSAASGRVFAAVQLRLRGAAGRLRQRTGFLDQYPAVNDTHDEAAGSNARRFRSCAT